MNEKENERYDPRKDKRKIEDVCSRAMLLTSEKKYKEALGVSLEAMSLGVFSHDKSKMDYAIRSSIVHCYCYYALGDTKTAQEQCMRNMRMARKYELVELSQILFNLSMDINNNEFIGNMKYMDDFIEKNITKKSKWKFW